MKTAVKRIAVATALLILALLIPIPPVGKVMNSIGDMLHAPLFAALAYVVFRMLHNRMSLSVVNAAVICLVCLSVFAGLTELTQALTGRTPSWQDLLADICGVAVGVLGAAAVATPRRANRVALSLVAAAMLMLAIAEPVSVLVDTARQRSEMPMLASFERAGELSRWSAKESSTSRAESHATSGSWSLRLDLRPGIYPGIALGHLPPNWSGHNELVADIWLAGREPLRMVVKVTDRSHNNEHEDRFQRAVVLSPGANTVRIALSDIVAAPRNRRLDLRRVATLSFFAVKLQSPRHGLPRQRAPAVTPGHGRRSGNFARRIQIPGRFRKREPADNIDVVVHPVAAARAVLENASETAGSSSGDAAMKRHVRIILAVVWIATVNAGQAETLHVAPNGNDQWSGRFPRPNAAATDGPLASLRGARDAIRQRKAEGPLTEPVRVLVADGSYPLEETLVLTAEDSGTELCPIRYEAAPGARPVFSGGRQITGFRRSDDGLWVAQVPEVAAGKWYFEQLWVNGRRAIASTLAQQVLLTTLPQSRIRYRPCDRSTCPAEQSRISSAAG